MSLHADATIQARMGSSRLPGKVLMPVAGEPLLLRLVERIQRSRLIDRVIIATTTNSQDDKVAKLAERMGCLCYRGSEEDVLGRVVGALREYKIEIHAEFQGDNALPDPVLIDEVIDYYVEHQAQYDYVTTALKTTYPPGSEVTVYPAQVLFQAEKEAIASIPREHVGPHIYQRPERFRCCNLEAPEGLHFPDVHLEVDTEEDYQVVCQVYEHFLPQHPGFTLAEAVRYALDSGLWLKNAHVSRRWVAYRSG
jgi:spore coat polysaccharide biosynthesis protein SpsF